MNAYAATPRIAMHDIYVRNRMPVSLRGGGGELGT
jgi:hypothetical protein